MPRTFLRIFSIVLGGSLFLFGCTEWRRNVTLNGIAFAKVKVTSNGLIVGVLKEATIIDGRPCAQGWVHLYTNGTPSAFTAAREFQSGALTVPTLTWVQQDPAGTLKVCSFPKDTLVQGHLCRGSGGPEGVQAAFYPDGALKQFFLRRDTVIQGIPCKSGLLNESIELHQNGKLKACTLSAEVTQENQSFPKSSRVRFDQTGRISPK